MDIDSLLLGIENCRCGKRHECDIEKVIIKKGALNELQSILSGFSNILLVADDNTFAVCGKKVSECLGSSVKDKLIYSQKPLLVPDERALDELNQMVSGDTDIIVGVGSGVINDLCKLVSFRRSIPYCIIATAPSMDGYASTVSAMIENNMKITYSAHTPKYIVADIDVLKNAPIDMIKSGYGDTLGKYSSLNDWLLSSVVNDEYLCVTVFDIVSSALEKTAQIGPRLKDRANEDIKLLFESLVIVGIAMSYVANSRPASGSEHHLSHFFEVVGLLNNEPYLPHGICVACSSVLTQRLREAIIEKEEFKQASEFVRENWEREIRRIYGKAAEGIIELQNKTKLYEKDFAAVYKEKWKDIIDTLKKTPKADYILGLLDAADISFDEFKAVYSPEKISDAIWFAKDLKDRYTVLWLYYLLKYKGE